MTCTCGTYANATAVREWDADCPKHGEGTPWWTRVQERAAELARERATREAG